MKKFKLKTQERKLLADTLTPVNIYLKLRDVFAGSILLESSDYHGNENSLSFICSDPIASFTVDREKVNIRYPDGTTTLKENTSSVLKDLEDFSQAFEADKNLVSRYNPSGLFGYTTYDAIRFFESLTIDKKENLIPDILYKLYRYVIVVDHFSNELTLFAHSVEGEANPIDPQTLNKLQQIIYSNKVSTYSFTRESEEVSNVSDQEFLQMVEQGKQHCYRGDVFQIVLSRRFTSRFRGDEFNVYRALRSINPSPYLFYFDYGNFRLMGSSPEAQIQIAKGKAYIYPIAGTFRRTGNDQEDLALAEKLTKDEKENAEHVMLVDLARNDMSRHAEQVSVEVFKEVQFYSHVIHLVSKVSGVLKENSSAIQMAVDTFPAGTLSGAPKYKAMTLINQYENVNRSFYGGAIGFIGFNGSFNHAIMIRTFLSKQNQLICQAGAGIVAKSEAASELQEVNNKLSALRKALDMATTI
ncbi:MAG: anthranilate synthase component I family protein [Cytophagia bacterium]|nr:anthranilate synthase component I family protein [Cytophagia bacterium]